METKDIIKELEIAHYMIEVLKVHISENEMARALADLNNRYGSDHANERAEILKNAFSKGLL